MTEPTGGLPPIKDTAEAIEGLVKAVPVYQDLVQPAAKEVGEVLARTVHAALMPLRGMVWGIEQIEVFVHDALTKRLKGIPADRIQTPDPTIAGPALEALRFAGKDEILRELYANLLATAMDREVAERAHPAFVDVIRHLTPDEAKILNLVTVKQVRPVISLFAQIKDGTAQRSIFAHFSLLGVEAGCQHPHLTPNYLENLCRLALTAIPDDRSYSQTDVYKPLEDHPDVLAIGAKVQAEGRTLRIEREILEVTSFGAQFLSACVVNKKSE